MLERTKQFDSGFFLFSEGRGPTDVATHSDTFLYSDRPNMYHVYFERFDGKVDALELDFHAPFFH